MRRFLCLLILTFGLLAALPAEPAAAATFYCNSCGFAIVCIIDECSIQEFCIDRLGRNAELCNIDFFFGYCWEEGDFCRLV